MSDDTPVNGAPFIPDWLRRYADRGFKLVFYDAKTKGPTDKGWNTRTYAPEDYRDGQNVGVMLGAEIAPGKFLADIDLDWADGVPMLKRFLLPTGFGFGRTSRKLTHMFYTTSAPVVSRSFDDIDGKPFVEIRGTKKDGSLGFQTMVPPSVHPSEEVVTLRADDDIAHDDDVERRIARYSIACILFQHLGQRGLIHDTRLAVAGFLLSCSLTPEEVIGIGEAVADLSGNSIEDVALTVGSTAARMKQGERVFGRGAFEKAVGTHGKAVIARIREWLGVSDFITNEAGKVIANKEENIKRGLEQLGADIRFDLFAQKMMVEYERFHGIADDNATNRMWMDLDKHFHFSPSLDKFHIVVNDLASEHAYHPVRTYLDALKWDGTPRVDEWLVRYCGAADTKYVKGISPIILLAAVRRVRQPGCKLDEMLVMESDQGTGKSTLLRLLCPNEEWFSDDFPLNVDAKEVIERTAGKWIIEAAELSGIRKSLSEQLKSMLSRQVDGPVRMAYARIPVEKPRQFVIIGTTNSHSYLTDSTGNRRFWPARVSVFDLAGVVRDRDQLWAEAAQREASGESIRLHPSLYADAAFQQERRRSEDPWEDILWGVYATDKEHKLKAEQPFEDLHIAVERRDHAATMRVSNIMQRLGFRKIAVWDSETKKPFKGWKREILQGQQNLPNEDE